MIQKTVRMHLARKKHRPRYLGILKIRKLNNQIVAMGRTVGKLKNNRESSQKDVEKLQGDVTRTVLAIKVCLSIIKSIAFSKVGENMISLIII